MLNKMTGFNLELRRSLKDSGFQDVGDFGNSLTNIDGGNCSSSRRFSITKKVAKKERLNFLAKRT